MVRKCILSALKYSITQEVIHPSLEDKEPTQTDSSILGGNGLQKPTEIASISSFRIRANFIERVLPEIFQNNRKHNREVRLQRFGHHDRHHPN